MEAGRARGNRGNRPFRLSLGLTSVRHIVDRLEAECTQSAVPSSGLEVVKYDPNVVDACRGHGDLTFATPNGQVWSRFAVAVGRCVPSVTLANFGALSVATALFGPRMISYLVLYPFCRLVFGTLYPAYASYKAVRTKNLKEYVKWMMYWIVFALFTCTETFTDVFLSWFPFYYEVKIVLVLWLLSPATKGSSILYRKFVHPALCRREQEIDEYIAKAKDQGYHTVLNLGTKGVNYATTVIMQTAIKGGGGLVQQLRKSYSLSDLTECDPREERAADEADDVLAEPRLIRRAVKSSFAARRSASESNSRQPMYFPEVDVDVRSTRSSRSDEPDFSHIKSTEDISSGYSSADNSAGLTRAGSVGAAGRARARTPRAAAVTAIKRPPAAEDIEVLIEEIPDDDSNSYRDMPSLVNISSHLYLSHTNPPFIYQYVGDQVKIIKVLGQLPLDDQLSSKHNIYNEEDQTEFSSNKNLEKDHCSLNNFSGKSNSIDDTPSNIPPQLLMSTLDSDKEDKAESTEGCSSKDQIADGKNNYNNLESNHNVADANTEFTKVTAYNKNNSNPNINEKELTNEIENETENSADDFAEPLSDDYSSDDEASYGTPSDSPTTNRKQSKGKYGKDRAPLPPVVVKVKEENLQHTECTEGSDNNKTSKEESITVGLEPNNIKNENQSDYSPDDLGPVNYNKTRQKSKSPLRVPKQSPSGFGKLLQLPSKLAFWHKADEKPLPDDLSVCSGEKSRRTSTDDLNEGFQKTEISSEGTGDIVEVPIRENSRGETGFRIANESDNETTSTNIIDKSDVLQKLIVAKIESHPEYKFVPLNAKDEIETTSKSTDV